METIFTLHYSLFCTILLCSGVRHAYERVEDSEKTKKLRIALQREEAKKRKGRERKFK